LSLFEHVAQKKVSEARRATGKSQSAIARSFQVSESTISRLVMGQ
jgi:transposase